MKIPAEKSCNNRTLGYLDRDGETLNQRLNMLDPIKLEAFRALLEREQLQRLVTDGLNCEANRINAKVTTKTGRKYTNVDIGSSGRYMVVNDTGEIFGIKAYGVIHRGHAFGTLDTIHDYDWSDYTATRKPVSTQNLNAFKV